MGGEGLIYFARRHLEGFEGTSSFKKIADARVHAQELAAESISRVALSRQAGIYSFGRR